jgi:hypothetical protein
MTFKEFVEEEGLSYALLEFGSAEYLNLVERFNAVKFQLRADAEAQLHTWPSSPGSDRTPTSPLLHTQNNRQNDF